MNLVALTGRLETDPDLHYDPAGRPTSTMRITITDHRSDDAITVEVIAHDSRATTVARHLTTGRLVGVEGRIVQVDGANQHRRWAKHQILATTIDFLDPNPRTPAAAGPGAVSTSRA
jgi:single-stranded DNA-binding protein